MDRNLQRSLAAVLIHEGGRVNDPRDPGGKTAFGITQRVYTAYRKRRGLPFQDVFEISDLEIVGIYKTQYWNAVKAHVLPDGLDFCVFDGAVNSGPVQSIKWLQRAMGPHYTGQVDGSIGQLTLDAIETFPDVDALIANYCARRLLFCKALKHWKTYGRGWSRRIDGVKVMAQAWAVGSVGPDPTHYAEGNRKAEVAAAKKAPPTIAGDATAGGGGGLAAVSTSIDWAKEKIEPYAGAIPQLDVMLGALAVLGVILIAGGSLYSIYARKKARALADALDTRPRQLVAPGMGTEEETANA